MMSFVLVEYEPECIHLDCVILIGLALMTYFEKKVNFDDSYTAVGLKSDRI